MLSLLLLSAGAFAQTHYTRNAKVSFYSSTPVEDIKAVSNESLSFLDTKSGEFKFQVLIKGFRFENARMQEHFNQPRYMDSDKYPKSEFTGKITKLKGVNFAKDGVYPVEVAGNLSIHGVTKPVKAKGTITVKNGIPAATSTFTIKRADYGISMVSEKIAEELQITVDAAYERYKRG